VLTVLPEMLRVAAQFRMIIYAIIMIASIILWPFGLAGKPREKEIDEDDEEETSKRLKELALAPIALKGAQPAVSTGSGTAGATGNILVVNHVTKIFGGLVANKDVSMDVAERSIHSIIGPNGAGKTTFFNTLSGFYKPQAGSILFQEHVIVGKKPDEISRMGMARTFQKIRLFHTMTALENVALACDARMKENLWDAFLHTSRMKQEERAVHDYALQLLQFVGLTDKRYKFAKNLSYGDQRRLEIARALATGLRLLLLDEPTAGMSPEETQEVIELIQILRDEWGLTIILIEHDMKVVMGISDTITVLDHGQKIAEGKPKEIQSNEMVIEAYLGVETVVDL
jgi:branched-chain amino acid transport system ATP-binding protein